MAFPELPALDRFINTELLSEPMSWFVVFLNATVSLLLMHVVMMAFGAMQDSKTNVYGAGPGQVAAPVATNFSRAGTLASDPGAHMNNFWGGGLARGDGTWTNDYESKFAEDGWTGNS